MNIYLVPIDEGDGPYIKKIVAKSLNIAEEKLYNYLFNKYEWLEGDTLKEITNQLWEKKIVFGDFYDIEDFT